MTRTPAPEEVAVLNEIVSAYCPMSQHMAKKHEQALAILDRLSPPAPEVDEATVWTRKAMDAIYPFGQTGLKGNSPIARLTETLSELIASKDAERDALGAEVDQLAMYLEDRDSELAAVSAAIGTTEFMDPPDGGSPTLAEQVGRMRSELAALRAENERLKEDLERARRVQFAMESANALPKPPYESATPVPKSSIAYTTGRAAERNPAEPEHRLSGEPPLTAGEVRLPARITRRD